MLIDDASDQQKYEDEGNKKSPESSMKGSKISYFQKSSPKEKKDTRND